jgi:tetratricopeptide (TPR) repeat protein
MAVAIVGFAATAHADQAEQLFQKGKKLLAEKKYHDACNAFEQSDRLDPGIGAKVNVARCYQAWGRLATAWRWYRDAEQMAITTKDDRVEKIRTLIAELDPTVPRLTVSLPADAVSEGLVVKLDDIELAPSALGSEQRVNPGPHRIETIVNGATQVKTVALERGGSAEITLDVPVRTRPRVTPAAPGVADDDPGRQRRRIGLGTAGGGIALLGIAGIVTLRARGDYHHALDAHCSGDKDMCDEIGQAATRSARRRANISTGLTIGGLAAVAAGVYLYVTVRDPAEPTGHALYVAPVIGEGTGIALGGAF